MSLERFVNEAMSEWMRDGGPDSDIVISSRIRIARNLQNYPFPMLATNQQSQEVLDLAAKVVEDEELQAISDFTLVKLTDLNEVEKRVLVEKHLISPALANESRNGAVILSGNEAVSIMINEEDHLRIQLSLIHI